MKLISFILPSRNNLKYLKWSYSSIRKHLGYKHEICMADDASTDGTWEWMMEIAAMDYSVKIHRNEGPERLGHTILYDTLVNDYATNDIVMIYHADMYACPSLDVEILKHLEPGKVVSATRIEPPLHPDGPEKIFKDFGIEPEEFDEQGLLRFVSDHRKNWDYIEESEREDEITKGIFAPWVIYKEDFQRIGGHDPLYAPQSKEDSDIFNRFVLVGYELIQTWKGLVYHMTSRGSRFKDGAERNPKGQVFVKGRESDEWLKQNIRSTRNFIRKWGHMVRHDELMYPIIPHKYDIGFAVTNCDIKLLYELEPWCSTIYTDCKQHEHDIYIKNEQPNTIYNLEDKLKIWDGHTLHEDENANDILVSFDCKKLDNESFQILVKLSDILSDSGEIGRMEYGIFTLFIDSLTHYEKELI